MTSKFLRRCARGAVPVALVLAAACTDSPLAPGVKPEPVPLASIECRVNVPALTTRCSYPEAVLAGSAIRTTRLMGGQDRFIRLENYGNTIVNDTLQMYVTVQNLLSEPLGTPDGVTVTGVTVFFSEDPSNGVTVANATGDTMVTGPAQPYFRYDQILTTYQVSDPMLWKFKLNGASSFVFKVYVLASQQDESGNGLEAVWSGEASSDWFAGGPGGNWTRSPVPDANDAVQIPGAGVTNMPVLTANATALHLRVNAGGTLNLGTFNLAVGGNVDGAGTISGGSVTMSGSGALLMGTIPSLFVTGGVALQGSAKAAGPVSVTGSLSIADSALSISIP